MSLHKLLSPRSVAIVGVSTRKATFQVGGRAVFDHLRLHGYPHQIDIVTRDTAIIDGVQSVTDLGSIDHVPDCVVISVPAAEVIDTVTQAMDKGCRAFVVISGGFAESGEEGAALQEELTALVKARGAALLGPNTTGFVNFAEHIAMSSTSRVSAGLAPVGEIGLVVQSGALGSALMEEAARSHIGLSHLISTGNEAVTGLADWVVHLADDPATRVIALYVEGLRDPDRMLEAARRAHAAGKPVVLYKAGRSDAGRRAAAGHTGALVGARGAYEAAVRQLGWIDVRAIEDLLPVAHYACRSRPARTMGVLTVSGGLGGCLADALEETGRVALPAPGKQTLARMRAHMPAFLSAQNPVDVGGSPFRTAGGFGECLDAFADDPSLDGVVIANTPIVPAWGAEVVAAIRATRARVEKPVSVLWPAEIFNAEALSALRADGVPTFTRIDTFVAAVVGMTTLADAREAPSRLLREGRSGTRRVDEPIEALGEAESKEILKEAGVVFPSERFFPGRDLSLVVEAARSVGYPVALKGIARGVVHKSELGLVSVGIADDMAIRARAAEMLDSADRHGRTIEGFLVAQIVHPQAEIILGLGLDMEFGPTLTFGAGGIYTEVLRDVAVRILPMDESEIRAMIESCRIARILNGARGKPALDVDALVALVMQVAAMAPQLGSDFAGLEFNPVGVGFRGEGVWPLDATVFRAGT